MAKYKGNKNKLKEKFENKYVNIEPDFKRKLDRFDKKMLIAEKIADKYYGNSKTNKTFDQIVEDLLEEFYSYRGSILNSFREVKTRTFEENVKRAMQLRVKGRMYEFMEKNGSETFEFNGQIKTLEGWEKQFLLGRITQEQFNSIIKEWEDNNPQYDNASYSKQATRDATIKDSRTE